MPFPPFSVRPRPSLAAVFAASVVLVSLLTGLSPGSTLRSAEADTPTPDMTRAVAFLTAPSNLVDGTHVESFPGHADVGLTADVAFALATVGTADSALSEIVTWIAANSAAYAGIGTPYAAGGSLGKIALVAEVTGHDPTAFGGGDLLAALDASRCTAADAARGCIAPGGYAFTPTTFGQAFAIMATWRGGDRASVPASVDLLEAMQAPNGSFPSFLHAPGMTPSGPGAAGDVDSTAMAAMALSLVGDPGAASPTAAALAWIASTQLPDGGFPGAAGDSVNAAGIAVQALGLDGSTFAVQIAAARSFLAANQNADGGFRITSDVGAPTNSDVRASAQATSGAVGVSFGVLDWTAEPDPPTTPTTPSTTAPPVPTTKPAAAGPTAGPIPVPGPAERVLSTSSMSSPVQEVGPRDQRLPATGVSGDLLVVGTLGGSVALLLGLICLGLRRRFA